MERLGCFDHCLLLSQLLFLILSLDERDFVLGGLYLGSLGLYLNRLSLYLGGAGFTSAGLSSALAGLVLTSPSFRQRSTSESRRQ